MSVPQENRSFNEQDTPQRLGCGRKYSSDRPWGSVPRREPSCGSGHRGAMERAPSPASRTFLRGPSLSRRRNTVGPSSKPRQSGSSRPSRVRSYSQDPSFAKALRYSSTRSSYTPLPTESPSACTPPSNGFSDINRVLYLVNRMAEAIDRRDSIQVNDRRNSPRQSNRRQRWRNTRDQPLLSSVTTVLNEARW